MSKFLSGRQSNLNIGINSFTENKTVLQTIGRVGIGTTTAEDYHLVVRGSERVTSNLYVDKTLYVSGVSTFQTGPVLIGGATSTGTYNQPLQVEGGAYISTYVSIGYTNPFANLTVFDQSGPWVALVDPGQSSSAFEDNGGDLYIRSESGSGTAGHIIFQTGTANYQLRPSQSGSNRMRIDTDGDVLINSDSSTGTIGQKLQVFGSSYIQNQVGIGFTNPTFALEVNGTAVVTGLTSIRRQTDIGGNLFVAGITTLTGSIDANADLDVEGHTELDNVNISGVTTFAGAIDANGDIDVDGHTELDNVNISGFLTATSARFNGNVTIGGTLIYEDEVNVDSIGIVTARSGVRIENGGLTVVGVATFSDAIDANGDLDVDGHTELDNVNISGVTTFVGAIDANGDVDVDGHTELDNVNISGIVTAFDLDVDGHTELDNVRISGITTFVGTIDANGDLDVDGHTELDNVNISGIVTAFDLDVDGHTELDNANISGIVTAFDLDVNGHTELDNVRISGFTTFQEDVFLGNDDRIIFGGAQDFQIYNDGSNSFVVDSGVGNLYIRGTSSINFQSADGSEDYAKFNVDGATELYFDNSKKFETISTGATVYNDLYVGGDLFVQDDLVFDEFTARNATLTGNVNTKTLLVSGVSTFTNGPVLIGTGASTGTANQLVQIGVGTIGGVFIAGNTGIGTTTPGYKLDVNGDINFNGDLYQDGILFVAGVGIASTEVNPQSATIPQHARVGSGFTDICFVGTGLSITGYGSTVIIDLDDVGGARVSVSTEAPLGARPGDLWWESDSGDLKVYYVDGDSSQWVDTNGGENLAVIGEFPPASPLPGDLWWDSVYGSLKIYYDDGDSQQWVDTSNAAINNYWVAAEAPYVGIHTTYNVGIGTTVPNEALDVMGYVSIDDRVSYGTTTAKTSATSQVGIHSTLAITSYRSVEYTIQATRGASYHTTKILALHDGTLAYPSEYGTVYNTSTIATYDVDVSGGNIRLLATPSTSGITTYNIIFDAIKI